MQVSRHVLPFREGIIYMVKLKRTILYSIVFTDFQHPKLHPFQNLSLWFIKISLKFRKFQLRYSYKHSIKKQGAIHNIKQVPWAVTMSASSVSSFLPQLILLLNPVLRYNHMLFVKYPGKHVI